MNSGYDHFGIHHRQRAAGIRTLRFYDFAIQLPPPIPALSRREPSACAGLGAADSSPKLGSAKDALAVMDFEELAHRALPPAHWGYMASGVDDNATRDANMAGYKRIQLRPRRLVDVSKPDLRINLFGTEWESPIFLCPLGGQKMFHPEGEVATARAARSSKDALQILSTQTSASLEDVAQALGRPPWYQLYMPQKWEDAEKLVHRVEAAGCPALAWTIDLLGGRNTETATRLARTDTRDCLSCHVRGPTGAITRAPAARPCSTDSAAPPSIPPRRLGSTSIV